MPDQQNEAQSGTTPPADVNDQKAVEPQPRKPPKPRRLAKNPARDAIARVGTTMDEAAKAEATASDERREVTRQDEIGGWKKMS